MLQVMQGLGGCYSRRLELEQATVPGHLRFGRAAEGAGVPGVHESLRGEGVRRAHPGAHPAVQRANVAIPWTVLVSQCRIRVFVCLRPSSCVVCAVPLQILKVITHPTPACKVGGPGRGFSCMLSPLGPPMGKVPPMVPIWGPPFLGMMWPCWPWPLRVPW